MYFKSKDIFKFCMKALLTIAMVMALSWVYNTVQNDFEFVSNITSGRIDGWIYDLTQMKCGMVHCYLDMVCIIRPAFLHSHLQKE